MPASTASRLTFFAEAALPTTLGAFRIRVYRSRSGDEPVAMVKGSIAGREHVPVRVHSACFTSETLHSRRCDCREQLAFALGYIQEHDGVVIYLHQEGRGIGLGNKIRAYALQEQGYDTVSANEALHLPVDSRSYEDVVSILEDLGIRSIRLMTNNPDKERGLLDLGVRVTGRIPVVVPPNEFSRAYLETKEERMGHLLNLRPRTPAPREIRTAPAPLRRRPYVHLNFALGSRSHPLDQKKISSPEDWRRVHGLRERYAAIAVGAETWILDRPRLTARSEHLGRPPSRQPRRVLFAGSHAIGFGPGTCPDYVVSSVPRTLPEGRIIPAAGHGLGGPLAVLRTQGVVSLLVEGGPRLWKSFLGQGLVDEISIFVATDSEDEAAELGFGQFPELPGGLSTEPFGGGMLLSWRADRDVGGAAAPVQALEAALSGFHVA